MTALPLLAIRGARAGFGGPPLFSDIDLAIGRGERLCLVGRNGSGKSTILKALAGEIALDAGERFVQPGTRVIYLPQEFPGNAGDSVAEHVHAGGAEAHRAAALIDQLGLDPKRDTASLSGGEGRRADLARVLAADADILLLDEPTNHLDLPTIEWLEAELARYRGGLLVISHDRAFLTRLCQVTLWLDREFLHRLNGGFGEFEAWSDQIISDQEAERNRVEQRFKAELRYQHRGVTARRRRNQRRVRELAALRAERVALLRLGRATTLRAAAAPGSGRILIDAQELTKSFDGRTIIDGFSTRILRGDRIGLIGPNGAGKTTLLRLLTGEMAPDSGAVRHGARITLTHIDQRRAVLVPARTLWETLCPAGGDSLSVGGRQRHVISYLKDFLFDESQARGPVSALSGGERNRLALAVKLAQPCNLLVLDEPTNDLDMDTLDLLEDMLSAFDGTLLLVSHDREFLNRLVTSVIALEGDGVVEEYVGGYDDYRRHASPAARPDMAAPRKKPIRSPKPARLSYREKTDLAELPDRIAALARKGVVLEESIAEPELFKRDRAAFKAALARLDAAKLQMNQAEARWLEVEIKRESLQDAKM